MRNADEACMDLLTHPDFLSFLRGVLRIEQGAQGILLHRTTARRLAHLDRLGPGSGLRGRSNAGQQIVLRTDATRIELTLDVGAGARRNFAIAACVDGVCTHPVYERELADGVVACAVDLTARPAPAGLHLVRLHLHSSRVVALRRIEVLDAKTIEPVPPTSRRLLCYGDSIAQGMEAISPLAPYPTALGEILRADMLNLAIGGHVFDADYLDADLPFVPDLVTVAYGTNDWSRDLTAGAIAGQATAFLRRLAAIHPQARVAVLTPLWSDRGQTRKAGGTLPEVCAAIAEAARAEPGVRVIDGHTLIPNEARYFVDGLHPNDLGFGHCVAGLTCALSDWLLPGAS